MSFDLEKPSPANAPCAAPSPPGPSWKSCGCSTPCGNATSPAADIRRRFKRSLVHLLDDYLPLATRWAVWDSRSLLAKRLAISSVDAIESLRPLTGL